MQPESSSKTKEPRLAPRLFAPKQDFRLFHVSAARRTAAEGQAVADGAVLIFIEDVVGSRRGGVGIVVLAERVRIVDHLGKAGAGIVAAGISRRAGRLTHLEEARRAVAAGRHHAFFAVVLDAAV